MLYINKIKSLHKALNNVFLTKFFKNSLCNTYIHFKDGINSLQSDKSGQSLYI